MAIQQTGVLGQRQLSTGGNPVTQGNKWGFGNGGVVWNGPGPAPTGQAAIDGINQMMAGSMFQGASFTPGADGTYHWNADHFNTSALPRGQVSTQPGTQPGGGAQAGGGTGGQAGGLGGINTQPGGPTAGGGGYGGASGAGVPQTGLIGAESALQGGLRGGLAGIEAGVNQAGQTLSPYTQGGNQAFGLQSALSGAMGPEAQRQAFANYNESPEVAYQREMGERAITRNAAATGGLGGGRVQQELQRHAIGLAQQDYGNSFNRLGSLAEKGYGAAGLLGGIQANAGGAAGQMAYGTGQSLAGGRTRAGEQIAGNLQGTTSALSQLINQQGMDLSNIIGSGGNNIANLLAGYGTADAQTKQALAALLANIATGSASQVAGVPGLPGANDPGLLQGAGAILSGIGNYNIGQRMPVYPGVV